MQPNFKFLSNMKLVFKIPCDLTSTWTKHSNLTSTPLTELLGRGSIVTNVRQLRGTIWYFVNLESQIVGHLQF